MNFGMSYFMWSAILCLVHFSCEINAQPCSGNGLNNECACNFINACTWNPSLQKLNAFGGSASDLRKLIPNLSHLAKSPLQVAEICEPGSFGIVYDCLNRIPIAATIVITAQQYSSRYVRPSRGFKQSSKIAGNIQQDDVDYEDALQRVPCIETPLIMNYYVEHTWFDLLGAGSNTAPYTVPCPATPPKSTIHRGHLVAASYGRGTPERTVETFVYTNAVPQFGIENSGSWNSFEQKLIKWARNNCAGAPLHVITGSIPSTYGRNSPRFFGQAGFSTYQGKSFRFPRKQPYRVNVPSFMWTAACCHSSSPSSTKSTAFYAPNQPGRKLVQSVELSRLFSRIQATHVDLFPGIPGCSNDANYISNDS